MPKFEKGNRLGKRFKPGESGNPGGKPKEIVEVAQAARERTKEALDTLYEVMTDADASSSARVSAAIAILERGWGRAPQTVTLKRDSDMKELSDDELIAIAAGTRPNGSDDPARAPEGEDKPH